MGKPLLEFVAVMTQGRKKHARWLTEILC